MELFPAIDLMEGRVVRLFQGDYNQKEEYGDDPAAFARRFAGEGASFLHLVDLDGAKAGAPQNFEVVRQVAAVDGLFVELGGGIRNEAAVEQCFEVGVGRVILGTSALRDPEFTRRMVKKYPERIAIGVDARDGRVAVEGWLDTSDVDSFAFCREMRDIGARDIIYTDISRDGAERGVNLQVYQQLAGLAEVHITASGGVSSLEDIRALAEIDLYAAILGKALYTGRVRLSEALVAAQAKGGQK